jgi:pyrophosphatase PpaX
LPDKEIVDKSFGLWGQGFTNMGVKDAEAAYQQAIKRVEANYIHVPLYEEARKLLVELKKLNKRLGLLTSSFKRLVYPALENLKLKSTFEVILTKDDVIHGKPNPEIVNRALDKLKGKHSKAIMIGDSYHDVQTGKNAGVTTVIFYPKNNHKFYTLKELKAEKPDYLITELSQLLPIVKGKK